MIEFTILKKKIYHKLHLDADSVIRRFLQKHFSNVLREYSNESIARKGGFAEKAPLFVYWWQGEEKAPKLVRICIASIRRNAQDHPVVLITQSTWKDWADIPDFIIRKVESKQISFTHFSDILRMVLLAKHGGLWLDATMFVAGPIPEDIFSSDYWTIHRQQIQSLSAGRWTGYCQAGKPNTLIHSLCRDFFYAYWSQYDKLIDYFLIDYVMDLGYRTIPAMKQLIDAVKPSNQHVMDLDRAFNQPYEENQYDSLVRSGTFFKLNWKRAYATKVGDKETMYHHFLDTQRALLEV